MCLKGEFTVEAAFIISIFLLIIAAFINLDFYVHDVVVSDSAVITGSIDYRESRLFCYDQESRRISVMAIAEKPVIGSSESFEANQKEMTEQKKEAHFDNHKFSGLVLLSETDINDVITAGDNAQTVRAGGKAVQIVGELK